MKISNPDIKVIRFGADDVIATSLFYLPFGQYSGDVTGSGNYVRFEGTMRPNGNGTYEVTNIYGAEASSSIDSEVEDLSHVVNGDIYDPISGVTFPATFLESVARQTYDAYSYDDGVYSHGVSYYEAHWQ